MVKMGMMLGDRYEILEKIGMGGMSEVYKAKCHKLNRFVAIKVLKQEFSENGNFVSKFKIEAQAAAGLAHPNIVNVYDVGEEKGLHYMVMELVEGMTLKQYITKKSRLNYREAVSIAIQVGLGLDAAHGGNIIHRDIKPQNIIISKEGKVKVTDFGIAKAATSNTITSNVMGSVHYTSPEQARGGYSDAKSDIYSLGITLFEMITGRVPFDGENTVGIAIRHIQEELPSPRLFVPDVPYSVEQIIYKCCAKSPDMRYPGMWDLVSDLKTALQDPEGDFVQLGNALLEGGTRAVSQGDMERIKSERGSLRLKQGRGAAQASGMAPRDGEEGEQPPDAEGEEIWEEEGMDSGLEKATAILAVVVGVLICALLLFLLVRVFKVFEDKKSGAAQGTEVIVSSAAQSQAAGESRPAKVSVPELAGQKLDKATAKIESLGLYWDVEYVESEEEEGTVLSISPAAGGQVDSGSRIKLLVSQGSQALAVPDVKALTEQVAVAALTAAGFKAQVMQNYSGTVAAGLVMDQSPAGQTKAPPGAQVSITVSLGQVDEKIKVPNLVGLTEEEGIILLTEQGLALKNLSYVYSAEIEAGRICYQSLPANTYVDAGVSGANLIDLRVSQGPDKTVYQYQGSIEAPTMAEAPEYVAGSEVALRLISDDGAVLLDTRLTSFPHAVQFYGISSPSGTLTMTIKVPGPSTTTTDSSGNTVTVPGKPQEKSFTRRIQFEKR